MLKGALFDLDGTLLDTEYYQWQGWLETLKPLGISLAKEDYLNYTGKSGKEIEKELIEKYNLKIKEGSLLEKKKKISKEWLKVKPIKILPFAVEALEFLMSKGVELAVVSGGTREEVEIKLNRSGLGFLFKFIVSGDDVKKGKPEPDVYLYGTRKINLLPGECIVFEDTQYGVESAKLAGLICLAIPNEFSDKQDFSKADAVCNNLREAAEWVRKKYNF